MRWLTALSLIFVAFQTHAAPLQTGMVDDPFPVLIYNGVWTDSVLLDAFNGGYRSSNDATASITFETVATGFTLMFVYDPAGDTVDVCVDADCTSVNTLGAQAIGQADFTSLASGLKTVTITKTTTASFGFDALYIHPGVATTETTAEFDVDGTTYLGVLDARISAGDMLIVLLLTMLALFQMFSLIVQLWKDDQ